MTYHYPMAATFGRDDYGRLRRAPVEESRVPKTLAFSVDEYRARLSAVQSGLASQGIDGMVSTTPENLTYVSGYQTPGYYKWQGIVIPADGDPVIVCRGFEATNVAAWSWFDDVVGIGEDDEPMEVLAGALADLGLAGRTVGLEFESWFLTIAEYDDLRRLCRGTRFVDVSGAIEASRVIKSPAEIEMIRRACDQAEAMMQAGYGAIAVGANENDLAEAVFAALVQSGGELAGLPPFIVSGPRAAIPHGTWAGRVLEAGDPVMFELPGSKMRYCGALLRSAFVAEVSDEHRRLWDIAVGGLNATLDAIRPGVTGNAVDRAMMDFFVDAGVGEMATHRAGYSIGINWPPDWGEGYLMDLSPREERVLVPGMTFHVPGPLLMADPYAVGLSETVVVTDSGCEKLTDFSQEIAVLGA